MLLQIQMGKEEQMTKCIPEQLQSTKYRNGDGWNSLFPQDSEERGKYRPGP